MELARKELSRKGVKKNFKQIRRIALEMGFGMLDVGFASAENTKNRGKRARKRHSKPIGESPSY